MKAKVISYAEDWMPLPQRSLIKTMEFFSGRGHLTKRYRKFQSTSNQFIGQDAWDLALDHLGVRGNSTETLVVPKRRSGKGLLLVANHPFGILDGVTLAWIASRIDPNFRVIANRVLRQEPSLNPNILPIEFRPGREATKLNVDTRRKAIEILRSGGVLALFPAGAVSWSPEAGVAARDDIWKPLVGRLIKASSTDVLPIRFNGANSKLFQQASRISLTLRLGLYMHEVFRRIDNPIDFILAPAVPFEEIPDLPDQELANWLRNQVIR